MAIYDPESNQHSDGSGSEASFDTDYFIRRLNSGTPVYWKDPEPIPGTDYQVHSIRKQSDKEAYITYNGGVSEAEVFAHELSTTEPDLEDLTDFDEWVAYTNKP